MPFWVSAILGISGIIYFNFFIEATALALVSDLLYGIKEERYFGLVFVSFVSTTIVLIISEIIKKQIKKDAKNEKERLRKLAVKDA